ncbi:anoctamin-1 [Aplochiton taeniatus]
MNRSSSGTEAWNGTERVPFSSAMSESPSVHSEKLLSLARSLSELGLDTGNGGPPMNLPGDGRPPSESGIELGPGLFFADGRKKVDYVLAYKYKKIRSSQPRISIASNGSVGSLPEVRQETQTELGEGGPGVGPDGEESKLTEEEKALIREEFEAELQDAGILIERDKQKSQGIGFIRLHIPWQTLSREAELQKIKVPVKKSYELRERTGIAGMIQSFWIVLNQPFQPDVPDTANHKDARTRAQVKTLTHPFIRDKLHLYDIKSKDTLFDNATRSRIVAEILSRTTCTQYCQLTGITALLANGVYDSAFPLHDGSFTRKGGRDQRNDRQLLHEEWANYGVMHKYQPVDLIRKYFGEQIGLYFAWLGVYTQLLIPPSVLGVIVFIYGILSVDTNVPSQETCDERLNLTMCPLCDGVCDYWRLSSVCTLARASYLFDNGATVLFAIFMSLWAACFLEHWKRRQMCLKHCWDLMGLEDEEDRVQDEPRPEYEEVLQQKKQRMQGKKRKSELEAARDDRGEAGEKDQMLSSQREPESLEIEDRLSGYLINISTILLMMGVTFAAVFGVIMYRIATLSTWSMNPDPEAKASVRLTVTTTAIIINLLVVLVLDEIYGAIAVWLTELEIPKTEAEFEERLILKAFFLKSMNAFAPIFYVAFFKGRFAGRPGDYIYLFGSYRMEECAPPGCLIELCIQLSMIMLGKQLIQNNVFEIVIPKLKKMYRTMQEKGKKEDEDEEEEKRPKQQFNKDHALEPFEGLSPEYMEMIIQYGFVSLFVASFPLAPAFALLNNVIEIRLDAAKFVTEIRRPDAVRCKDIGIWYNILCGISKFSVITNAFVISFTSEFIPRMVFQYMYSKTGSMHGYTEHSLAYFNVSNFAPGTAPTSTLITGVSICRYKDYRDPPWASEAYTFSKQYWSVLAARLAFVIFFQNLAMFLSMLVAWLIPDVPRSLRDQLKKEKLLLKELLLSNEQDARPKSARSASRCYANIDIVVEAPEEPAEVAAAPAPAPQGEEEVEADRDSPGGNGDSPEGERPLEGSVQSISGPSSAAAATSRGSDPMLFILKGPPPPRDPASRAKARCSTLPPRQRGTETGYSLPRPSHSTSLTRFQQLASHVPLVPLRSPTAPLSNPLSAPHTPLSPTNPLQSPPAQSGPPVPKSLSSTELFVLKGPPRRETGSRAKGRCSTLPARQRGPEAGMSLPRPSQSTSFTKLGDRVPPSPSELKHDSPV